MGLSATEVRDTSLWQLSIQAEGFADAHAAKDAPKGLTEDEFDDLSALIEKD